MRDIRNVVVTDWTILMRILPGLILALIVAIGSGFLSKFIGISLMGLPKSPISTIMMSILIGMLVRNTIGLNNVFQPGVRFGLVRVLRVGIVLLGIRLSFGQVGDIGLRSLPVIIGCIVAALTLVTFFSQRLGVSARLGSLIAVGTSICGATAIVATAPTIDAREDEVAYSVACITLFGMIAMLSYPFVAHWMFDANSFASGLFLGTAIHETSQVAGAGLVYQQYYDDPLALDVATVAKLVRNLGMLIVIPLVSILHHSKSAVGIEMPRWWTMIPMFVVGFACMSLVRTVGDSGELAFGVIAPELWNSIIGYTKATAETCLAVAMASVGLGTSFDMLRQIGARPMAVGLFSALLVGCVSILLIKISS